MSINETPSYITMIKSFKGPPKVLVPNGIYRKNFYMYQLSLVEEILKTDISS